MATASHHRRLSYLRLRVKLIASSLIKKNNKTISTSKLTKFSKRVLTKNLQKERNYPKETFITGTLNMAWFSFLNQISRVTPGKT